MTDAHIRILRGIAGNDAATSRPTMPPATQPEQKPDAAGCTYISPRHKPQSVSPKPRRDGAGPARIASR